MPSTLADRLALVAFAGGSVALLVLGPGRRTTLEQPRLVEEKASETARVPGPQATYERLLHVDLRRRSELDRLLCVPDPRALRTRIRRVEPDRVLDPTALGLRPLAAPREGRPLVCSVSAQGARSEDRLYRVIDAQERELEASPLPEGVVAELRLGPLAAGVTRVVLRWRGQRGARVGLVEAVFELRAARPPSFALGPGLDSEGPLARALSLQGFRAAAAVAEADLFIGSLGRAPPDDLAERIDRGLGCLLVAEPGRAMAEDHLSYAPVVPGEAAAPAASDGTGRPASREVATEGTEAEAEPAEPVPPAARVLRPGGAAGGGDSRRRRARRAALVLLVDASRSMSRAAKIAMAKEGARRSANALGPGNDFALLAFGSQSRVVLALGPASRKRELDEALGSLRAEANNTRCLGALLEAWRLLKTSAAAVRHVVILSDGEFHDIDAQRSGLGYEQIARAMRREGINLSGIRIHTGSGERPRSDFLFDLSRWGGGRYHATASSGEVPRLLLGVVELVRGAPTIAGLPGESRPKETPPENAEPDEPVRAPVPRPEAVPALHRLRVVDRTPALAGLATEDWPRVAGYLPLEARLSASTPLSVGAAGHAFLATGLYGLGRVAALGGSDGAPWCDELVARPWYPRLVGQLASWLLPAEPEQSAGRARPLEAVRRRVLDGEGTEPGLLAEAAKRVGGLVEDQAGPALGPRTRLVPRAPTLFLVGLLALWLWLWLMGRRPNLG